MSQELSVTRQHFLVFCYTIFLNPGCYSNAQSIQNVAFPRFELPQVAKTLLAPPKSQYISHPMIRCPEAGIQNPSIRVSVVRLFAYAFLFF
jgi:hypothetical protein